MRAAFSLALVLLLAACASLPRIGDIYPTGKPPVLVSSRGPLTAQQSQAILNRISTEPGDAGILKRHVAIDEAVAETPLVPGNRTHLLQDGDETFRAMFAAIKSARQHINLEYYIFEDVESDGEHLGDLLIAKRQAGVAVNIIYDSYGSKATKEDFFKRLKQAGINLVEFHPINPLQTRTEYAPNNRDHRKILVVDGDKAIIGGINISTTYQSSAFSTSGGSTNNTNQHWRDTDIEIDGPVVAQLQALFVAQWSKQKGPALATDGFFPTVRPMGTEVVRIIGSTPDKSIPEYYVTLLSSIRNAEKNVWVSAAYFVPADQEEDDLMAAARRGVDVRLLLPGTSDSAMAAAVAHSHYGDLLNAGVKIYETKNDLVLHSKTVVIDGVWTLIGSSNFDRRSILYNDEVDGLVLGSATGEEFQRMFAADIAKAQPIDIATWKRRSLGEKALEVFATVWQDLL
ncbi:MAG TPA: phospholipase D-like domain-containing protein [Micropepsaceae bacterium]|nr:phospholipase D-like domain-containing protein [Micropepsaceae bacterium]